MGSVGNLEARLMGSMERDLAPAPCPCSMKTKQACGRSVYKSWGTEEVGVAGSGSQQHCGSPGISAFEASLKKVKPVSCKNKTVYGRWKCPVQLHSL